MRLGISIGSTFTGDDHREGPRSVVAQARAAAAAGLDSLTVGDHHSTGPAAYVQNVPIIGRVLAEWPGESETASPNGGSSSGVSSSGVSSSASSPAGRPIGCLFLVPLWHPVLMAEQIGTLAAMADGPFIVQAGAGGGRAQFAAMGADPAERGRRTEEGISAVQRLLAGETVDSPSWDVRSARIAPLPPAGVEWWIGGGVAASIDRAARLGDCWYGNADLTPRTAADALAVYRDACARHDREPVRIPIRKDVYIAERAAEAEEVGDALVAGGYRGFDREAVAYGDPAGVAEQLAVYGEIGFTDVIIRIMTGGDAAVRAVELAGEVRRLLAGSA